ncbi:MAG: hydroxyacid dehydrogenase [Clostridium sp.]|nr:hydroxyacid dehydrogenase [Clostridium sp.]
MGKKYNIIHFEALGAENEHLKDETAQAIRNGLLPKEFTSLVTDETLQEYMREHPDTELPDIISIKTHSKVPEEYLRGAKKSIITRSAGYDHVEELEDVANVASLREYCVNAVAQTAMKLLYDTAGCLNEYTLNAATFERMKADSFIELNEERVATVFGVGKIGKHIYDLLRANGLTVQAVDIREKELGELYGHTVHFVSKEQAAKNSDIIINSMNLTRIPESRFYNVGYFSEEYLRSCKKGLIFVNVTRGEIAPESAILKLYEEGHLSGFGTDVFSHEDEFTQFIRHKIYSNNPDVLAGKYLIDIAEARTGNIYVQPHQGFNSDAAAKAKAKDAIHHVTAWYQNAGTHFEEQLPYYAM